MDIRRDPVWGRALLCSIALFALVVLLSLPLRAWLNLKLFGAIEKHRDEEAIQWVDIGAAVDARDHYGRTPLVAGVDGMTDGFCAFLLSRGADVNASDHVGQTALMGAAGMGDISTVRLLLAYGADPSRRDADGMTAAGFAARKGHADVVRLLRGVTRAK